MSEEFFLDEIRVEKWDQMQRDTEMYCRKNQLQLELAAQKLLQPKKIHKKAADWINLKLDMIGWLVQRVRRLAESLANYDLIPLLAFYAKHYHVVLNSF